MTLQQLEYFLASVRYGSFSQAADALHLAQPSISEQIRRLEGELGVRLFTRVGRGLVLTEAGETLREHAERVLQETEAARASVSAVRELRGGTATFGMFGASRFYPVSGMVADFRRLHPAVRVRLVGLNSSEVADAVRDGDLEAGLIALPVDDRGLDVRPLMRDEILYLSSDPEAVREPVTPEDIASRPLVLYEASYGNQDPMRRQLSQLMQQEGRRLEPDIELEDVEAAVDLAGRGLVNTLVAKGVLHGLGRRVPKALGWAPFAEPLLDTVALVNRDGGTLSPASEAFLELATARLSRFARDELTKVPRSRPAGGVLA